MPASATSAPQAALQNKQTNQYLQILFSFYKIMKVIWIHAFCENSLKVKLKSKGSSFLTKLFF